MKNKKSLSELTIKDNFMFAAVMMDSENCKPLLEMILDVEIDRIEVSREKSIVYNPEYHGIRMDVYAKDEAGSHYNIEMQVRKTEVVRRSRYYHSQMDMEMLAAGTEYEKLPNAFVIFICDYDPFGYGKYRYTQVSRIKELPEYEVEDGNCSIFLSTRGKNREEVSDRLVQFLEFVRGTRDDSEDLFVKQLQKAVEKIRKSREMGNRYMIFQEMLREEYNEGFKDGESKGIEIGESRGIKIGESRGESKGRISSILDLLGELGSVDEELEKNITACTDLEILKKLFFLAVKAESIEQFKEAMKEI